MKDILVVDDEKDIRESTKVLLEKNGYSVRAAANGEGCLSEAAKKKPDLILLDVMMPGTPAREVIQRLKGTCPILLFTVVRMSDAEKKELIQNFYMYFLIVNWASRLSHKE